MLVPSGRCEQTKSTALSVGLDPNVTNVYYFQIMCICTSGASTMSLVFRALQNRIY